LIYINITYICNILHKTVDIIIKQVYNISVIDINHPTIIFRRSSCMSNKDARLSKIRKIRDRYTFLTTSACIAAVVAVVFSPTIPITVAVTAVGASIGLF
jgi:hypothetical protein